MGLQRTVIKRNSTGPDGVICRFNQEEFPWLSYPSLLTQDDHWLNYPDLFHIWRHSTCFCYDYISSDFWTLDFWVSARKVWWLINLSGWERGIIYVLLKHSWVVFMGDSLKTPHVSKRTTFMWSGMKLRVTFFLVQLILQFPYKLLSFDFGLLSFWYSCTESPALRKKDWMLWLLMMLNDISSKWMSWPS